MYHESTLEWELFLTNLDIPIYRICFYVILVFYILYIEFVSMLSLYFISIPQVLLWIMNHNGMVI